MNNDLKKNLENFDDEEILRRIATDAFTEEAKVYALEILDRRGCKDIDDKVSSIKFDESEKGNMKEAKDKRIRNLLIFLAVVIFPVFLSSTIFPLNNSINPILITVGSIFICSPIALSIWRNNGKILSTIGILVGLALIDLLLKSGGIIWILGWMVSIIYNLRVSSPEKK